MRGRDFRKLLFTLEAYRAGTSPLAKLLWFVLTLSITGLLALIGLGSGIGIASGLVYLPILLATFLFGVPGGLAAAVLAGLPLRSLPVTGTMLDAGLDQGAQVALITSYLTVGVLGGGMFHALRGWRNDTKKLHNSALRTFAALVETYDTETGAHCERVAANACTLGRELGLSEQQLKHLYWAGYLHDLGKVVLPSELLRKPGKLSESEYELVRRHAGVGARMLTRVSNRFEAVAEGIVAHHERWNGGGYPFGLRREDIPLFGRILAVIDVFEAVTSDRPYQLASPAESALAILRNGAGTDFDPRLVMLYEKLYWEGRLYIFGKQDESLRLTPSRETLWDITNPTTERDATAPVAQGTTSHDSGQAPAFHTLPN